METSTFNYKINWQIIPYKPEDYVEVSSFFMVNMTAEYIYMVKKKEEETGFVNWTINLN